MSTPHDHFAKMVLKQHRSVASGLLQLALPPAVIEQIALNTLRSSSIELIDKRFTAVKTDLLFEASTVDGRDALVFVLVEHQSSEDASMAYRMFHYLSRIWEEWRSKYGISVELPLVLSIVLYHGATAWRAPLNVRDLIVPSGAKDALGELLVSAPYVLFDTSVYGDEALMQLAVSEMCQLALLAFANVKRPVRFAAKLRAWLDLLKTVVRDPEGRRMVELVLRYYDQARGPDEFSEAMAVARELDTELEKAMYTAADMLRDEGREEGREQGREEGRAEGLEEGREEGQRSTLRRQLEFKFGSLPTDAVDRLQTASSAQLSVWTERILSDDSLEELLNTRPRQKD
ncbi:MAG: Rpn family recombination-promoting nuclease/putative transposase [Myxococcota bacterium]